MAWALSVLLKKQRSGASQSASVRHCPQPMALCDELQDKLRDAEKGVERLAEAMNMRLLSALTAIVMGISGCAHTQRPEARIYVISESAEGIGTGAGTGGAGDDVCQKELEQCMNSCWEKKQWPYPHNKERAGWYYKRCTADCNRAFVECEEQYEEAARQREEKLKFSRMSEALEWIREHKTEVAIGTVVIVAGVAFFVTTGGSGALLLAPLAL